MAVFAVAWEEVGFDEIPWSDRLAGDEVDVAAGNAEVRKLAVRQAVQLGNGFPVATPVAIVADQVHGTSRFVFSSFLAVFCVDAKIGASDSFG